MMESAPSRTGTIASDRDEGEIHDECGESGCVGYSDLVYFKTCATDGYSSFSDSTMFYSICSDCSSLESQLDCGSAALST